MSKINTWVYNSGVSITQDVVSTTALSVSEEYVCTAILIFCHGFLHYKLNLINAKISLQMRMYFLITFALLYSGGF